MASVQAVGIENVCSMFAMKKVPYFAVSSGSNIIHSCNDLDNIEDAENELRSFLEMMHQSSNAIYTVHCFVEKPKAINKKSLSEANFSFNFRLNLEGQLLHGSQLAAVNNRESLLKEVSELKSEIGELKLMLDKSNHKEDEEDEEDEKSFSGVLGKVAKDFVNSPQGQAVIWNFISGFINPKAMTTSLAGIPGNEKKETVESSEEDVLTSSLTTLFQKGVTIEDIRKLSEMEVGQINFLLGMLRK